VQLEPAIPVCFDDPQLRAEKEIAMPSDVRSHPDIP
jgi:hypothetical protein